jgi:hypothetical protein
MARLARVVIPGVPHHVTQRGNRRQATFFSDEDYEAYLDLMAEWCGREGVEVWAYCLMPNHFRTRNSPCCAVTSGRAARWATRRSLRGSKSSRAGCFAPASGVRKAPGNTREKFSKVSPELPTHADAQAQDHVLTEACCGE